MGAITMSRANAEKIVLMWTLWPDIVAFLEDLLVAPCVTEETEDLVRNMLKRVKGEVQDDGTEACLPGVRGRG